MEFTKIPKICMYCMSWCQGSIKMCCIWNSTVHCMMKEEKMVVQENKHILDYMSAIVTFICEELYPVSLVEEPSFKTLMTTIDPGYSPQCKK